MNILKKSFLAATLIASSFSLTAQDAEPLSNSESNRPDAGSLALELGFNPGAIFGAGGGNIFNNAGVGKDNLVKGVKARYFSSEDLVLRGTVDFAFQSWSEEKADGDDKASAFSLLLAPGVEKHLGSSNNFAPYVGAELPIRMVSASNETSGGTETTGTTSGLANSEDLTSSFSMGINLIAGLDYYIVKNLYVGAEFGFTLFDYTSNGEVESGGIVTQRSSSNMQIGGVNNGAFGGSLRLGWAF